eukprot:GHVR01084285.1.p1 GENE.GHVR01084285.1~~GHVR01084285.1.p1  ORF type:complete len:112 (+),score=8.14 GHVR01084285.1:59-394(+)
MLLDQLVNHSSDSYYEVDVRNEAFKTIKEDKYNFGKFNRRDSGSTIDSLNCQIGSFPGCTESLERGSLSVETFKKERQSNHTISTDSFHNQIRGFVRDGLENIENAMTFNN